MSQNKKFRKFAAASLAATATVVAVAPAVAAAQFDDVTENNVHADNISKLVEAGVITGYPNGEFRPAESIQRRHVAVMLFRQFELEAPADVEAVLADYTDVSADDIYADEIAAVIEAGFFKGSNGEFMPIEEFTREQMATVLVRAFALEDNGADVDVYLDNVDPSHQANVKILAQHGLTTELDDFRPKEDVQRGQFASFVVRTVEATAAPAVESVSAINKTTVEVKFNTVLDSVEASNFTIEGASVTAATLSEDKKTATLTVSGLDYDKTYAVAATLPVQGEIVEFAAKEFTTPAVADLWNLVVETQDASLTANGSDNTPVTFKLVDKVTGQVDENADNVVLKVSTTRGSLANDRITIQDGKATTTLTSEFSSKNVTAKIDAQIIEASGDYNQLIGKVVGTKNVQFQVTSSDDVTIKTLVAAESNQADRVTLFFDNNVNLMDFVETDKYGNLLYTVYEADGSTVVGDSANNPVTADTAKDLQGATAGNLVFHAVKDHDGTPSVDVAQGGTSSVIQGFKPVAGNSNAIEVILANPNIAAYTALTDNQNVEVTANISNSLNKVTESKANFVLTDARNPEVTSVKAEGMNKVVVQFSESVADGNIRFDGLTASDNTLVAGAGTENEVELGEFNALTLQDTRAFATITLDDDATDGYLKAEYGGPADGYFKAGSHSIQVSNLVDHAFATDSKNKGTTQTLQFSVKDDATRPDAKVVTQSPEQFILNFDKVLKGFDAATLANSGVNLEVFDPETEEWGPVVNTTTINGETVFTATQQTIELAHVDGGEYKVEVELDWKDVLVNGNDHYSNYKFRLAVAKDAAVNEANGLANSKALYLDLSRSNSALTKVDNTSPVIKDIQDTTNKGEYVVVLSEPIKANNLASPHNGFQVTGDMAVKFQGKDKDGKTVEFEGTISGYNDDYDTEVLVKWTPVGDETPQTIVDAGGSETWTVVATSVADDIGNTASTLTKDFTLQKTPESVVPFTITAVEYDATAADNKVIITFSTAIQHTGGVNDATALSHYTLNGLNLPSGSSIAVEDTDPANDGYEGVVITVPDGTLAEATPGTPAATDTITVNKNILDKKGVKLTGQYEWVVVTP